MTLHGKIQNGVIVLDGGADLPDGTPVTVVIGQVPLDDKFNGLAASEPVLAQDWNTPEEDAAWADL